MNSDSLNLTATGHMILNEYDRLISENEQVGYHIKNKFKTVRFRITQALDVFSHEVQQRDLTYFTDAHESNQMLSLFGNYFMALDWDYESESLFGFESFKDKEVYIDVITALPDNNKVLLYSNQKKRLYYLSRQKPQGKFDRIYE